MVWWSGRERHDADGRPKPSIVTGLPGSHVTSRWLMAEAVLGTDEGIARRGGAEDGID